MERLYTKVRFPGGRKLYAAKIHGKHVRLFKRASDAQTHSERLRARYRRLKAARVSAKEK